MPQPYTRQVFYQFTADHQDWYVTDSGADSADFEEVRKNGQEDSHMSGTIELLAGVWRVDEGSRVQIGDNTAVVAIEAHFNEHGVPSEGNGQTLDATATAGPGPGPGHRTPWEPGTRVWLNTGSPAFTVIAEVIEHHSAGQVGDIKAVAWVTDGEVRITLPWQCWTRVETDPATLQEELESERVALRHAREISSSLQQRLGRSVDNAVRLRDELAKKDMADPAIPARECLSADCTTIPTLCERHTTSAAAETLAMVARNIEYVDEYVLALSTRSRTHTVTHAEIASISELLRGSAKDERPAWLEGLKRADPPFIPGICVVAECSAPSVVGGVCREHSNPM